MRPTKYLLLIWLFVVLWSSPWQSLAGQDATPISGLVVEPSTIKVARFDQSTLATVTVIARTTGAADLSAELTFTASPGLEIKIGDRSIVAGDIVWPVRVRVMDDAPDDSAVDFRLTYAVASAGPGRDAAAHRRRGPPRTTRLQRARLAVTVAPSHDASPVADADISIKTDFTNIIYGVSAKAYILVNNKSNYPFTFDKPEIAKPDFLTVAIAPMADRTSVPPHETKRVPIDIGILQTGKSRVGDWLILASLTLRRGEGVDERTGTAVVEQKVTVGVPGVSDVLKALDLPSLLLVPGALVLATWSLLLGGGSAAKPKWLEWKSSSFWLVSITISIVVFAVASMIWGTNFLVAYNVDDVGKLWLGCVGGGAGTFLVYRVAEWGLSRYRAMRAEAERQAREPLGTDKPIAIMRKLSRANLRFYLESYLRSVAGLQQEIFKIDFPAPDGMAWAVPQMLVRRRQDNQAAKDSIQRINAANDQADDGRDTLVAALELGLANDWISLAWKAGELSGPRLLPEDELGEANGRNSPIKFV
jgi:hypothetical protein